MILGRMNLEQDPMRSLFPLVLMTGLLLAGAARGQDQMIIVGTAPVAGIYYPAGGALCRLINAGRARHGLRCLVESTAGSKENLARLRAGELDFALVQSDWLYHDVRGDVRGEAGGGTGDQEATSGAALRAVVSLHAQPFTLVARPDSGIAGLSDLEGKRLNLGPPGSVQRTAGEALIEALGWTGSNFAEVAGLAPQEQVEALCSGRIDAFLMPISHPNGLVGAAAERCRARLVPIEGEAIDMLVSAWPFYAKAVIPGGLYPANVEPVATFGLHATVVTRADTSEHSAYWLVRSLFDQLDAFRRQHPALANLSPPDMVKRSNILELHEGAIRYYNEQGWQ